MGVLAAVISRSPTPKLSTWAPLADHVADDILVEGVGGADLAVGETGVIEHPAGLLAQIGDVARIDPDSLRAVAVRQQHLIEGADGIGDAGFQGVVGIDEQGCRNQGYSLGIGAKGVELVVKHLDPAVRHGAEGGDAERPVGQGTGGADTAADIGGSGSVYGPVVALTLREPNSMTARPCAARTIRLALVAMRD